MVAFHLFSIFFVIFFVSGFFFCFLNLLSSSTRILLLLKTTSSTHLFLLTRYAFDLGLKYITKEAQPGHVRCHFCDLFLPEHLAGGYRNATACNKVPAYVREEIRDYLKEIDRCKREREVLPFFDEFDSDSYGIDENVEVQEVGSGSR